MEPLPFIAHTQLKTPKTLINSGISVKYKGFQFGGAEGSRTPVQKPIRVSISERSRLSTFPYTKANRHAFVLSSR